MVQTTEAKVTQLSGEIAEDQQAVRQLLHNVSEALRQMKSLQAALNPPAAVQGKIVKRQCVDCYRIVVFKLHSSPVC